MKPPRALHRDSVVIIKTSVSATPDASGVPVVTQTEHPWEGVNVQQVSTQELVDGRDTTVVRFRVAGAPPAAAPASEDLIRWGGVEYRIEGEPSINAGKSHAIQCVQLIMVKARG